jgi:small subunit ribosomal protein S21
MVSYNKREVAKIKREQNKHYYPQEHSGICVIKRDDESDDDLVRRFRKKYSKSGIAKELRERMFFEKPSKKRRRKRAQAIRMIKREEEKVQIMKEKTRKQKMKRRRREQHDRSDKRQNYTRKIDQDKKRE